MVLKLYSLDTSPPVRAVYLTAEALGIELEHISISLVKGEQLNSEFVKLNPQHTVPTLDDDGKIIWDSHAIMIYLVTKYSNDRLLYPEDPFARAIIHQRLHFDSGLAFPAFIRVVMPILFEGLKTIPKILADDIITVYEFLETFLKGKQWAVGDFLTLADLSLLPTITTLDCLVPINGKFVNIRSWIERCEKLPYYHVNKKGLDTFRDRINRLLTTTV